MLRELLKLGGRTAALAIVLPAAGLALFGRFEAGFLFFAQCLALIPGIFGSYLRVAYYRLTLEGCGQQGQIAMGSYFSHPEASLGERVGIGAYCVIGQVDVGDRTLVASGVHIVSGFNQHARDRRGRLTDQGRSFRRIKIGADCWVGARSVIMADLGDQVTVAAGTVVSRDVASGATVAGNPSRIVRPPLPAVRQEERYTQ